MSSFTGGLPHHRRDTPQGNRRPASGKFFKESPGGGVGSGLVVFVAGVRPPARGGAKAKEPRS